MDVNILQLLGLEELFGEGDAILEVEDILDSVKLPMSNPWAAPQPVTGEAAPAKAKPGPRGALMLAANILIYLLCAAVIAVSLILGFGGYSDSILGYHIYHVESGSMTPTPQAGGEILKGGFRQNDAIIVKNAAPENVGKGDVITFWLNDECTGIPNTHRVVEVLDNGGSDIAFVTKGDHNGQQDPDPVPGARLIGVKVLTLPRLGGPLKWADAHPWITAGASAGVMFVVFAAYIATARRKARKEEEF
ncbi:MAG: signal peptidase I [Oscillospiraceae bacterium]|jgi:signal peptidase|nr:signal peptidase I [Oscillospiraceae bacterium]